MAMGNGGGIGDVKGKALREDANDGMIRNIYLIWIQSLPSPTHSL